MLLCKSYELLNNKRTLVDKRKKYFEYVFISPSVSRQTILRTNLVDNIFLFSNNVTSA